MTRGRDVPLLWRNRENKNNGVRFTYGHARSVPHSFMVPNLASTPEHQPFNQGLHRGKVLR
jgi:hypothetical protein